MFLAACVAGVSCAGDTDTDDDEVTLGTDFQCVDRTDDQLGFLQPICQYIASHFDTYPIDPNVLAIEDNLSGAEQMLFNRPEYASDRYRFVGLSCCYTGDWAVMDGDSRVVVDFMVGDL